MATAMEITGDDALIELKEFRRPKTFIDLMDVDVRNTKQNIQLFDLPDEVIVSLLSFLPLSGLLACTTVSRSLNRLVKDPTLWKGLFISAKESQKDAPSARLWCSSVIHRNKMYIAGGHTTQGQTNYIGDVKDDLYEYDFATKKWRQLEAKLAGRTEHKCVVYNDMLWFVGGYNGQRYTNDIHTFNPATKEYVTVQTSGEAFSPRSALTAVVWNNKMITFGGWNGFKKEWYNDVHSFDFTTKTWTKLDVKGGEPPTKRTSHAAVLYGKTMYVFAGFSGEKYLNDLHAFDLETGVWTDLSSKCKGHKPEPRSRFCASVHGSCMYVLGGWNAVSYFSDLHCFDFETGVWTKIANEHNSIPSLSQCALSVHGDFLYIFGGYCAATHRTTNDLYVYKVDDRLCLHKKRKFMDVVEEWPVEKRQEGPISP